LKCTLTLFISTGNNALNIEQIQQQATTAEKENWLVACLLLDSTVCAICIMMITVKLTAYRV